MLLMDIGLIGKLKQKENEIAKLQKEFQEDTSLGSCFIVAGVLHKHLGGKVIGGFFKGMSHWWIEVDGIIYDFNCLDSSGNEFVCGDKNGYEKEFEIIGNNELKREVNAQCLLDPNTYNYWFNRFEEVLLL